MPLLKINHVIICDDVRMERNGKYILIGVYTEDIGFPQLPANFSMTLWFELDYLSAGTAKVEIRAIHTPSQNELFRIDADAEIQQPQRGATLVVERIPILIPGPGEIVIQHQDEAGVWRDIKTLPVAARS